jgi:integrative and conjugative element protein (TIGR02256 family)
VIIFDLGASGQRLILEAPVVQHLEAHRQVTLRDREAGGQLFAAFVDDSIVVKEATGPRRRDHRTRTSYRPDRKAEQEEILEHHRRGQHYVGDWHTHPVPRPSPSHLDYRSIQASVRESTHHLKGFVLIIVGTLPAPQGLHVSINDGKEAFALSVSGRPALLDAQP